MTPSDLIADLRDIHTPPAAAETALFLSPAPLLIFAALLAVGVFWSYWRRTAWRREGTRRLSKARNISDPSQRWAALITLYQQVARRSDGKSPPEYLFQQFERLGAEMEGALVSDIERRLR